MLAPYYGMTNYRCLSCGAEWERRTTRGKRLFTCPAGCGTEHRREVHLCEVDGAEWLREVARGQAGRTCPAHRTATGRSLIVAECATCGARIMRQPHSKRPGAEFRCSYACIHALTRLSLTRIADERDLGALADYLEASTQAEGECRLWTGALNKYGYPDGQYRLVYRAAHGEIPTGDHVHHKCARAACLNPDHLALSTARENIGEMLGRRAYEARLAVADAVYRKMIERLEDNAKYADLVEDAVAALGGQDPRAGDLSR